ncbi:hypothetical protein RI367_006342 [Sorochytrium milnesiophthora]
MVKLAVLLRAQGDNVQAIHVPKDLEWHFVVQCSACRETNDGEVTVNMQEEFDISGSRGRANLVMKCKFCKREFSASFEPASLKDYTEVGDFQRIALVECRGVDIVDCKLRDGYRVSSSASSQVWDDVDLSEGEWCEYDDNGGVPVALSSFEVKIEKA